jgi:hypothetical protein
MRNRSCTPVVGLLLSAVLLALSGCKLVIKVPEGGSVVSTDGAYVCEARQTCTIDVVDLFFDETFVAEPAPGYSFGGWKSKGSDTYLCGGETTPCRLSTEGFADNAILMTLLESDEAFVLEPRFSVILGYCPDDKLVVSPAPQAAF